MIKKKTSDYYYTWVILISTLYFLIHQTETATTVFTNLVIIFNHVTHILMDIYRLVKVHQ